MSVTLEMHESHHGDEIADVQAGRGRVESHVSRDHAARQYIRQSVRVLRQQPTPTQFLQQSVRRHGT